ncbi:hypothetical protein B0A66_19040 [Flavobacterium hercynium]|uniref:Uncharacterized protein n=1 Tax=Flavobacterium hercynium TaxID=387094 RepID=A0A226GUH3_9FLAO|nr:hypothetical protein B0A66_19040 [Flavobacterium hercynium]
MNINFSKDSKIKPFGLKILNFKDKKISRKTSFLSDIIYRIIYALVECFLIKLPTKIYWEVCGEIPFR